MQSGAANTKDWVLDFELEAPRHVEPLMGWTSSGDMRQQLRLRFESKEEAIAYCERCGIPYQVTENVAAEKTHHVLRGQFFLQAPRRLDPLIPGCRFGLQKAVQLRLQPAKIQC